MSKWGEYIYALLSGFLISFIGELPLGVLNSTDFQIAALQSIKGAIQFAIAVVFIELIVVRITLMYSSKIKFNNKIFKYVLPMTILLLYLAFSSFTSQEAEIAVGISIFPTIKPTIILGIVLSVLNPLQIPFWLGRNSLLIKRKTLNKNTNISLSYITGIDIGSMTILLIFIYAGNYIFNNYVQYKSAIQIFMGFLYLGFSMYMIYLLFTPQKKQTIY